MAIRFRIKTSKADQIFPKLKQVADGVTEKGKIGKGEKAIQITIAKCEMDGEDIIFEVNYLLPVPATPVKKALKHQLKGMRKIDRNAEIIEEEAFLDDIDVDEKK